MKVEIALSYSPDEYEQIALKSLVEIEQELETTRKALREIRERTVGVPAYAAVYEIAIKGYSG